MTRSAMGSSCPPRDGGSGLGLSLAQAFIHYHRGVIECDSRPGRTVFRIILPLA